MQHEPTRRGARPRPPARLQGRPGAEPTRRPGRTERRASELTGSERPHPHPIAVAQAELDDLRDRLRRTRWPERETVDDWSQGIPLAYVQELCAYWADGYDWRRVEAELNRFEQFRFTPDVGAPTASGSRFCTRPRRTRAPLPLVLTHGWPGSVVEFLDVIEPLSDPTATAATRPTRSTSCAPRCPATGSATSRRGPAGASSASPTRGPS